MARPLAQQVQQHILHVAAVKAASRPLKSREPTAKTRHPALLLRILLAFIDRTSPTLGAALLAPASAPRPHGTPAARLRPAWTPTVGKAVGRLVDRRARHRSS